METYRSVLEYGEAVYEDRKSVFYGFASPVSNEEEALAFIKKIKSQYPDARHHVYAYVLRENHIARYSDDREPQGTAGMPTLDVLRKQSIENCVVVVVRYFGGVLLGTGGLVKAYGTAAKEAVNASKIIEYATYAFRSIDVSYNDYQKILPMLSEQGITVDETSFTDRVAIVVSYLSDEDENFVLRLQNTISGRAITSLKEKKFCFRKIP